MSPKRIQDFAQFQQFGFAFPNPKNRVDMNANKNLAVGVVL